MTNGISATRGVQPRPVGDVLRVYISMPMSGFPGDNMQKMIDEEPKVREWFKDLGEIEIVNPGRLPKIFYRCLCVHPDDPSISQGDPGCQCPDCGGSICTTDYRATMIRDMLLVEDCDVLWLDPRWYSSLGCCLEVMTFLSSGVGRWIDRRYFGPEELGSRRAFISEGTEYYDPRDVLRQYLRRVKK